MKTLYLDCFSGIAGDMFIGALLNLVPDKKILIEGIKKIKDLNPDEYELIIEETTKNNIAGINFDVKLNHAHEHEHEHEHSHEHHHRHLADIEAMITSSELSQPVKREILRAFSILAEAEAHVHGTTPDKIHFHEVGAVDSIIDIAGAFILMEALDWPRVLCSPINTGSGLIECAHGILPVPAPATEFLLHGLPIFAAGSPMERTTPTGALLAKIFADGFCAIPNGKILTSGFGFGNHESPDMPNALRVLLMETSSEFEINGLVREKISLLEANIDDMNPQDYELAIEKLFAAGALDVWTENINMKKSRPGVKFCCLSRPEDVSKFTEIILRNTTSQGVRFSEYDRLRLKWRIEQRETELGKINFKITELNGQTVREIPEYEDLKKAAETQKISLFEARKKIK